MDQTKILVEVKSAIDNWMDKTYNESEFYSHILTIIRDAVSPHERHREQLERFINKVNAMRAVQRHHDIHKNRLIESKNQGLEVDQMILAMLSKGYSIERFNKTKTVQTRLI